MQTLTPWQEVVGEIDQIEQIPDGCQITINGYTIEVASSTNVTTGEKVAVLRTTDSYLISKHE